MLAHKPQTNSSPPIAALSYNANSHSVQLVNSRIPQLPIEGKRKEVRDVNAQTSAGNQVSLYFSDRERRRREMVTKKKRKTPFSDERA